MLRLLLRLVPLLLLLATSSTFTASDRALASSSLISMTPEPPISYAPSYSDWTPCQPDEGGLTRTEWAACSTAYNLDRLRGFVTVALFLLLAVGTATFLVLALRR